MVPSDSVATLLSPAIIRAKSAAINRQSQQGRSLESLLQWAIADIRALLQADRVLICRYLGNQDAVVAFEAVGAESLPLLGQSLYAPCVDDLWDKDEPSGRAATMATVPKEVLAPSYVQVLKRLQVQASLVVPLCSQVRLWGFLIVHHCRSPLPWQPLARQLLQQIARPLGVAIQQAGLRQHQQYAARQSQQLNRSGHNTGAERWSLRREHPGLTTAKRLPPQSLALATVRSRHKSAQADLQQQAERQRLLTLIAQDLRRTLDLDEILQTTVTAVRQFLQTDRVIIYRFAPDWSGTVIAEAVAPGWRSLLGLQITDTYFVATQGHSAPPKGITVINDIATANLAPCYIALLEQMQVRASLVVPLRQGTRPWGLIVVQHCRASRQWKAAEIALQQQLTTPIEIAIQQAALYQQVQLALAERQRAETGLQQLNQELEQRVQARTQALQQQAEQERLLRTIIQNIHCSLDLEATLAAALSETRLSLKADRVAIYQFYPDWSGRFIAESVGAGWVPLVQPEHPRVWEDTHLQDTQGGRYQHNEIFTVNDIETSGHSPCHLDLLRQFQARAYVIAPILLDNQLWGLLAIYQNSGSREWQTWESSLLQQVATQMAIALRQAYAYQAAQAQVQALERLTQLKDDFLSTVSHELRTPMSSIKMATQMLEVSLQPLGVLDDATSAISRYFHILREEGKRELSLINDLLDLTRLDAGTEPLQLTTIALQYYLPHLAESFIERTQQQQQHLVLQIPDDLPDCTTDLPYLERIVTELLHNACKYTPAGETITVSAQATTETWELCVSNTGVEIPATEYERIFDKFYRIPNNDPWKHGGTGLGLALVKKLTACLGGQIHVESGNGQTTFVLTFRSDSSATALTPSISSS